MLHHDEVRGWVYPMPKVSMQHTAAEVIRKACHGKLLLP